MHNLGPLAGPPTLVDNMFCWRCEFISEDNIGLFKLSLLDDLHNIHTQ